MAAADSARPWSRPGAAPAPPRRCRRCRDTSRCRTRTPSRPRRCPGFRTCPVAGIVISSPSSQRAARSRPDRSAGRPASDSAISVRHGVPDRRLAGLQPAHRAVRSVFDDGEPVEPVERLAARSGASSGSRAGQRHERVDPGRLDAAPAAVLLLAGEDPCAAAQRGPPDRLYRSVKPRGAAAARPVDSVQGLVEAVEEASTTDPRCWSCRRPAARRGRGAGGGAAVRAAGLQLIDRDADGARRPEGPDDGQRRDRLPGPAARSRRG